MLRAREIARAAVTRTLYFWRYRRRKQCCEFSTPKSQRTCCALRGRQHENVQKTPQVTRYQPAANRCTAVGQRNFVLRLGLHAPCAVQHTHFLHLHPTYRQQRAAAAIKTTAISFAPQSPHQSAAQFFIHCSANLQQFVRQTTGLSNPRRRKCAPCINRCMQSKATRRGNV